MLHFLIYDKYVEVFCFEIYFHVADGGLGGEENLVKSIVCLFFRFCLFVYYFMFGSRYPYSVYVCIFSAASLHVKLNFSPFL